MQEQFYRFRSLKSLFEYKELENQTIYFASPEELNDPMEGFRDVIWSGDKIAWKNLFRHYFMCLEYVSGLLLLTGEENHKIDEKDIPIFNGYADFPTPQYKELFEKMFAEFFDIFQSFIDKIDTRTTPARREELLNYLNFAHSIGIDIIQKYYEEERFISKKPKTSINIAELKEQLEKYIDAMENLQKGQVREQVDTFLDFSKIMKEETKLLNLNSNIAQNLSNRIFVFVDFPEKYINQLEKLIYPKWYTACFMMESHNSSIWGHYGENHQGVCLIFDPNQQIVEDYFIKLNGKIGWGNKGAVFGKTQHKFYPINYEEGYGEIDFFRSIGRLPIPKLYDTWFVDNDGSLSNIATDFLNDEEQWRKKHWEHFYRDISIKTKDWKHEKEYRLILNGGLNGEIKKEHRILTYDFSSLKGIIFGIKTSREDKLKIIEIIANKCKENEKDDFEFYQAYYSPKNKNIQHMRMNLLKNR